MFIVFRLCRVYKDVGATHKGVVRSIIIIIDISFCTQRTINNTTYLSTLDYDVHIAHHSSLMIAGKNYGNVKGRLVIIVIIIEITINIYINSTFDRHIWATH